MLNTHALASQLGSLQSELPAQRDASIPTRRSPMVFMAAGMSAGILSAGIAHTSDVRIEALSLAAIPDGAMIEIQLPVDQGSGDVSLSVELANHFAHLLNERGYRPVDDVGELILRFFVEEPTYSHLDDRAEYADQSEGSAGTAVLNVAGLPEKALAIDASEFP